MAFMQDTFDALTELADLNEISAAAAGAGKVGGVAKIVDVGPAFAQMIFNVSFASASVASGEASTVVLQGSNDKTFATGVTTLVTVKAGNGATSGTGVDLAKGDIRVPVMNSADGVTPLRYLRVFSTNTGASNAAQYRAYLTKSPLA